jgi:hypothetical protein
VTKTEQLVIATSPRRGKLSLRPDCHVVNTPRNDNLFKLVIASEVLYLLVKDGAKQSPKSILTRPTKGVTCCNDWYGYINQTKPKCWRASQRTPTGLSQHVYPTKLTALCRLFEPSAAFRCNPRIWPSTLRIHPALRFRIRDGRFRCGWSRRKADEPLLRWWRN